MAKTIADPENRPSIIARKASRRQIRDAEAAKDDLIASATKEFAENGFANAGIEAIAKGAGLNKRMIYHHFGSKEELYIAVLEHLYINIRANEDEINLEDLDPTEAMTQLVERTWQYFLENPALLAIVSLENTHRGEFIAKSDRIKASTVNLVSRVEALLVRGAKASQFREGIDAVQLIHSIAALGFYYLNNRFTNSIIYNTDLTSEEALETRRRYIVETILAFLKP